MIEREILPSIQKHLSSLFIGIDPHVGIEVNNFIEAIDMVEMGMGQQHSADIMESFPFVSGIQKN